MKKYSQCDEDLHIANYLKDFKGTLLDIGANDGKTFSNSLRLIESGWDFVLVEPSPTCIEKILALHENNNASIAMVHQLAIGTETGEQVFYESGQLNDPGLNGAKNLSLVSTLIQKEKERWEKLNMQWNPFHVKVLSWNDFLQFCNFKIGEDKFDFITIDAEGLDIDILEQMNLKEIGVKLLCIEWNGVNEIKERILKHTSKFGMENIIYQSGENLLIAR